MNATGYIAGINGPVIKVKGSRDFKMLEMVKAGNDNLIGEVIGIQGDETIVQVYENTTGIKLGEKCISMGKPMSCTLGPGIIGNIFDGIERPLKAIRDESGVFISRGIDIESLDTERLWEVNICVAEGESCSSGMIIATVAETSLIEFKLMIPNGVKGKIISIEKSGKYKITEVIAVVETPKGEKKEIKLVQEWPIRKPRPVSLRKPISKPLITGQRVIDSVLPIAKGGTAAIPGGFGTGKTMTQHQLAKWSDADIIVYIGCGERGNEMTQVLEDFSKLIDPISQKPLMDRTVLIANTSNMPVAAREASIYTGITLAEFYRDMGYHVAIMADSTSRWAEALREISGRLEEMPAEEGFPAYLSSRLSGFYERAGYMENLNGAEGSVTIIGAVSPQGSDFSEPVTQNTKRFVRGFWALDKSLAYARHYPAIHWLNSYSEYLDDLSQWYEENISPDFMSYRNRIMTVLQEENKLLEIVKLIGADVLPDEQKLVLDVAKAIRQGFLQQNAYHKDDTYVPILKQFRMMKLIITYESEAAAVVKLGIPIRQIQETDLLETIIRVKYTISNDNLSEFDIIEERIKTVCREIKEHNGFEG